jgi:hypothetical protein
VQADASNIPYPEHGCGIWIVNAPSFWPLWPQYQVSAVHLADIPGLPPPVRSFPTATHELIIAAINPAGGPQDANSRAGDLCLLIPPSVIYQFEGTNAEAADLCVTACRAIVQQGRCPETMVGFMVDPETGEPGDEPLINAPLRQSWLDSLDMTLAHIRGHHHKGQ